MGEYKNPIPSVDDKNVSKEFYMSFAFEDYMTKEEAIAGINNLIKENNGEIPSSWVLFGKRPRMQSAIDGTIH